jgi:DNA-binding XRE family transcriptional regulator
MKFGSREYFRYLEEIQKRSSPSKVDHQRRSSVEVSGPLGLIRVRFDSALSPQLRRAIIRGFFRHNREWLRYFKSIAFKHTEHVNVDPHHAEKRGLPLFQSENFNHPAGRLGFEIRLRRLNLGLTQAELSRRTGIPQSYISQIERGIVAIRADTQLRLLCAMEVRRCLTKEDYLLSE